MSLQTPLVYTLRDYTTILSNTHQPCLCMHVSIHIYAYIYACIYIYMHSSFSDLRGEAVLVPCCVPSQTDGWGLRLYVLVCDLQYAAQLEQEKSIWGARLAAYLLKVRKTQQRRLPFCAAAKKCFQFYAPASARRCSHVRVGMRSPPEALNPKP